MDWQRPFLCAADLDFRAMLEALRGPGMVPGAGPPRSGILYTPGEADHASDQASADERGSCVARAIGSE